LTFLPTNGIGYDLMVERTLFKIWCQKIKNENRTGKILILISVIQPFFIGENLLKIREIKKC
jgi:hypothetical protein